jgi:hypothetical protein
VKKKKIRFVVQCIYAFFLCVIGAIINVYLIPIDYKYTWGYFVGCFCVFGLSFIQWCFENENT